MIKHTQAKDLSVARYLYTHVLALGLVLMSGRALGAQDQAWGFSDLHDFHGGVTGPGAGNPYSGVILGTDGNYYGTTWYGGKTGGGVVFRVTPAGVEANIHSFNGPIDGNLAARPVQGRDGALYGTAYWGGGTNGTGIIYRLSPEGGYSILQLFPGANNGPSHPGAGLVQGADGNFYATSLAGGATGQGTLFQLTPSNELTVLFSFGGSAGSEPASDLIQTRDGALYGTTRSGGDGGYGTVFRYENNGTFTVLHAFSGGSDGAYPAGAVLLGQDGAFYGTTQAGGAGDCARPGYPDGCGTVYRVTAAGDEIVLHQFAGYPTDGSSAVGGLVQDAQGIFYGTTELGGIYPGGYASGGGTIFSITADGSERVIFSCGEPGGGNGGTCYNPAGTLLLSDGHTLTGAAELGITGWGNVFQIAPVPTVTMQVTPDTIQVSHSAELAWQSTNTKSCKASDAWAGSRTISGGQTVTPASVGAWTYMLTCKGVGGTTSASVLLTVTE